MQRSLYPIEFDVVSVPSRFDRAQVVLRLILMLVLAHIGTTLGSLFWLLYLALPVAAAVLVSQHGAARYVAVDSHRVVRLLQWAIAVYAYLLLLTDRFPMSAPDPAVRFEVHPEGVPTVSSALWRLITTLPMAIALALLGIVSTVCWFFAMLLVLVHGAYPRAFFEYQVGVVRWLARLWAYHASLVQSYPPASFESGREVAVGG
jgi:hypothetical protein